MPASPSSDDASAMVRQGDELFESATGESQIREAIEAYEAALRSDPANRRAVDRLAEANIHLGAAYEKGRRAKGDAYRTGIRWAERSMARDESFRRRVDAGESIGAAVEELGQDEMRAMLLWVTGVSYYFKECVSGLGKLIHFRWMIRTKEVMERMLAVDPEFENGAVLFSLAIYHIGAPPGAGRDMELSAEYLERAIEVGPDSLLPRWGRAKYFYSRTGNRTAARSDLEWVIAQDPETVVNPLPWAVYFQRDAREMLVRLEANR